MKLAAFLLVLFFVFPVQTSEPQSQPSQRISLETGPVTVWLGMPKAEAVKRFTDNDYEVTDSGDLVTVSSSRDTHNLWFTNGLLVYADTQWAEPNTSVIDAVSGALGALADKSQARPCSMTHDPISQPGVAMDRLFIACGDRSVLIANGKIQAKPVVDVEERIGNIPPPVN